MTDLENDIDTQNTGMDNVGGLLNWIAHQEPVPVGWTLSYGDDNEIYWDNPENYIQTPYKHLIPSTLPVNHDSPADLTQKYLIVRFGDHLSKKRFQEVCGTHANGTTKLDNFYTLLEHFGGLGDFTTNQKAIVRATFQIAITDWHTDTTLRSSLEGEDY